MPGYPGTPADLSLVTGTSGHEIRAAVLSVRRFFSERNFDDVWCGAIELILAEALNNIAEHAYGGAADGSAEIRLFLSETGVCVRLVDTGIAFGREAEEVPRLPEMSDTEELIPEGGFGRYLIDTLTQRHEYRRVGDQNVLTLWIDQKSVTCGGDQSASAQCPFK